MDVTSTAQGPATPAELERLTGLAGDEYIHLLPLYRLYNGITFHQSGEEAGLLIAAIDEIAELNEDWRGWFDYLEPDDVYDFQKDGFAFATIAGSGNYFVCFGGKVHYSDHDGGDDAVWGESLVAFFERALSDPAKFLYEAGCYTRYSDGMSSRQYIPETFSHD